MGALFIWYDMIWWYDNYPHIPYCSPNNNTGPLTLSPNSNHVADAPDGLRGGSCPGTGNVLAANVPSRHNWRWSTTSYVRSSEVTLQVSRVKSGRMLHTHTVGTRLADRRVALGAGRDYHRRHHDWKVGGDLTWDGCRSPSFFSPFLPHLPVLLHP